MARTVIPDIASLKDYVGHAFEPSEWVLVDQARIDAFAEATGDRQWIHCDPERARKDSPFGTTIAHGHLTLSLAPMLLQQSIEVKGVRLMVNPGIEHARLRSPVPAGSRVRMRGELTAVRELKGGAARVTFRCTLEVEGEAKPAAFGDFHVVYFP
jgi:acyl dehydratase